MRTLTADRLEHKSWFDEECSKLLDQGAD